MSNKLWLLILLCLHQTANAIPDVSFEINRFHAPDHSFAEISLYVVGSSIVCPEAPQSEYGVDYILLIKDTSGSIVAANRYRLTNTGCPGKDFIDIRRFKLAAGTYTVEAEITDMNDKANTVLITFQTEMEIDPDQPLISDIQLLSRITPAAGDENMMQKSGLYLEPLPFRYYYPSLEKLYLYVEAYHADKIEGQPYMQYTIKPKSGDIPSPVVAYKKLAKQDISANVFQLDITSLISGPYTLEAAMFDGNKNMVTSRTIQFSRHNPSGDSIFIASGALQLEASFINQIPDDSLDYFLKAMAPIVSSVDVDIMNALLKKGSPKAKQFFIHRYWTEQAGKFADEAFKKYMVVAKKVDELFRSGFGYGFETDRGHVFLKYGIPDEIIEEENEPSAPPYEIWFYNNFPETHQSNVRFLFYNPSLARNAFKLLHSTALGEVNNSRWEIELYRDATLEAPGVNGRIMGDNVNRNARTYFEN